MLAEPVACMSGQRLWPSAAIAAAALAGCMALLGGDHTLNNPGYRNSIVDRASAISSSTMVNGSSGTPSSKAN